MPLVDAGGSRPALAIVSPPDLTKDRIVFRNEESDKAVRWFPWLGAAYLAGGVLLWIIERELPLQAVFLMLMGAVWLTIPRLPMYRSDTYVDREDVGWPRPPFRRQVVRLADTRELGFDTADPKWATKVMLTMKDGTTRKIPTATPVELFKMLESRRAEATMTDL